MIDFMELKKVGEKTYYIQNPTNIGIYKINDTDVYIIDSGNDKDAGKKILKITDEQGWNVKGIIFEQIYHNTFFDIITTLKF